jgi:Tol biopolymer transport system component
MQPIRPTPAPAPATAGHFDKVVAAAIVVLAILIGAVLLRGDRVGVQVVAFSPAAGALSVSPRTPIRLRVDRPLDPAVAPQVQVEPAVAGTVQVEGESLVFTPASSLAPDTVYTVTVAPGLRTLQGRELLAPYTWNFRTGRPSIVFSRVDEQGREQLMLAPLRLDDGPPALDAPRQLTQAPFGIWDFAVDPIGGQIVFSQSHEDGTSDLWTLLQGAVNPSPLRDCPRASCSSMAFGPDSRVLAFAVRNASDFSSPVVSPPRLWMLDVQTMDEGMVFGDDQQLAFEPRCATGRQWISFLDPTHGGVGVYNVESGARAFYPTTTGEGAPWRPGTTEMVISELLTTTTEYEVHLVLFDPVAGTRRELSAHPYPVEDNTPVWSPDGEWLIVRRKELAGPGATLGKQLWRMRADGSQAEPLTADPAVDYGPVTWSADGRYLVYHRIPLKGPDVTISVWVMEVATGQEWEVARPGQRPLWVP